MTITSQLEGRAKGLLAEADYCSRQADSLSHDPKQYEALIQRAKGYRIAAEELQVLADEWRGTRNG